MCRVFSGGRLGTLQAGGRRAQELHCPLGPVGVRSTTPLLTGRIYLPAAPMSLLVGAVVGVVCEVVSGHAVWFATGEQPAKNLLCG